jgi:hypothetical protein
VFQFLTSKRAKDNCYFGWYFGVRFPSNDVMNKKSLKRKHVFNSRINCSFIPTLPTKPSGNLNADKILSFTLK